MKNIICIDLTKFNNEELVKLSVIYKLPLDNLIENKKSNFAKVFIDTNVFQIVAFTTKKDKNTIVYTSILTEMLESTKSVTLVKEPKLMTIDSILDKISKFGINSLSINEKTFLDNSK